MAIGETAAALIGAGIGAGGAVLAQIAAQIFTGRRDTKRLSWEQTQETRRLAWEKSKQAREDEQRSRERFLDSKRELYSTFLAEASVFESYYSMRIEPGLAPDIAPPDEKLLQEIRSNIELIAPDDVAGNARYAANEVIRAAWTLHEETMGHASTELMESLISGAYEKLDSLREAMRTDLRGEPSPDGGDQPSNPARQPDA